MDEVWIAIEYGFYAPDVILGVHATAEGAKAICATDIRADLHWVYLPELGRWHTDPGGGGAGWGAERWKVQRG